MFELVYVLLGDRNWNQLKSTVCTIQRLLKLHKIINCLHEELIRRANENEVRVRKPRIFKCFMFAVQLWATYSLFHWVLQNRPVVSHAHYNVFDCCVFLLEIIWWWYVTSGTPSFSYCNHEFHLCFFEELNLKTIRGNSKLYFCGKYVEETVVKQKFSAFQEK